ncbi:MAG: hypothetical protein U0269_18925 [Polyangiales bacterium]
MIRSSLSLVALCAALTACGGPRPEPDAQSDAAHDPPDAPVDGALGSDATVEDASDASDGAALEASSPVYRCVRPNRPTRADAGATDAGVSDGGACNGAASLCDRRYDQVAYTTTHNAFSVDAEGFGAPNQSRSMRRQLDDGVRAMMLDVYSNLGRTFLCHGTCALGRRLLADGLCEITKFLDENPNEVVSIIFESYVPAAEVERAFVESELIERVRPQQAGAPWPTLRAMIEADQRVVVFTDRDGGARPWYLNVWAHAWETPFSARTPMDLDTCAMNRGDRANPLFIFNHFLTNPLASRELAQTVNFNPLLIDRARRCQRETSAMPNFVTVDYYDIGDALSATRTLNGL